MDLAQSADGAKVRKREEEKEEKRAGKLNIECFLWRVGSSVGVGVAVDGGNEENDNNKTKNVGQVNVAGKLMDNIRIRNGVQ